MGGCTSNHDVVETTLSPTQYADVVETTLSPTQYADVERMHYLHTMLKKYQTYDKNLLVGIVKLTKTCAYYSPIDHELEFQCKCCGQKNIKISPNMDLLCADCGKTEKIDKCGLYKKIQNKHIATTYCNVCHIYQCKSCEWWSRHRH